MQNRRYQITDLGNGKTNDEKLFKIRSSQNAITKVLYRALANRYLRLAGLCNHAYLARLVASLPKGSLMIYGNYVDTFLDASHAVAEGMHMNADYPFKCPSIESVERHSVKIVGSFGEKQTAKIIRRHGKEYFWLEQFSTFEKLFCRKGTKFKFHPFKDEKTKSVGAQ